MLSDIEIAQNAEMLHIKDIAKKAGIGEDDLEFYGKYKAKISSDAIKRAEKNKDGKLILVTAINPMLGGRGKNDCNDRARRRARKSGKECNDRAA